MGYWVLLGGVFELYECGVILYFLCELKFFLGAWFYVFGIWWGRDEVGFFIWLKFGF